jgi:ribosome-binding factor A
MRGKVTNFAANKTVKEMKEGKRQKQVASVFQAELNDIFMKLGLNMFAGGMVSIADVKVTPDLLEARIYLSLFQVENPSLAMKHIEDRAWEIKKLLGEKIKSQVRRMPVIHYFLDDTLEHVFKMEELFKKIEEEKKAREAKGE